MSLLKFFHIFKRNFYQNYTNNTLILTMSLFDDLENFGKVQQEQPRAQNKKKNDRSVRWIVGEMEQGMKIALETQIYKAIVLNDSENEIASELSSHFEKNYGGNWKCRVGKQFNVMISSHCEIYQLCHIGPMQFYLYKEPKNTFVVGKVN